MLYRAMSSTIIFMNSLDSSQVGFSQLDGLTQQLTEFNQGGLEQPIATLLKLADIVRGIGQECEQLHTHINQAFSPQVSGAGRDAFDRCQTQLEQIIVHCKGDGQSPISVKKLWSNLEQWRRDFVKIQRQVEETETQQGLQQACQALKQEVKQLQEGLLKLSLDDHQKLDRLKRLIEIEQRVGAVSKSLDVSTSTGGLHAKQQLETLRQEVQGIRSLSGAGIAG